MTRRGAGHRRAFPSRLLGATLGALALAVATPRAARTQADTTPSATISYWGPIPAAADSVTAALDNRPTPLWEETLLWPYRVISLPFTLFRAGFGATVTAADRNHLPDRIGRLLRAPTGPVALLVHVNGGGLSGVGGGVTTRFDDVPGAGHRVRASVTSSFRGDHRVRAGWAIPLDPEGAGVQLGAGYRVRPNARFFGFGPDAPASDESFYRQQLAWAGAAYERPLGAHLAIEAQGLWSEVGATATDADDPPLAVQFAGALPPGYGRYASGASAALTLVHDNTTETGRPARGGVRRLRAVAFHGFGSSGSSFATYRAELQQFLTVGYRHHVVAVRAVGSWIAALDGRPVPFQYLLTNDDPDLFRGYQDFRWRDRGLALLSAEYRWPIWALTDGEGLGVDVYLLGDLGQVFGSVSQLSTANLTASYGVGLRLLGRKGLTARLEYGRSADEWVLRLRGDQVFQFIHEELFYGHDPIPFR